MLYHCGTARKYCVRLDCPSTNAGAFLGSRDVERAADQLGVALGDISGKGVSAALLMASLQALLRSQAPAYGNRVDELIGEINRLMYASTGSSKYATFFYGLYDDTRRTLTYVNAGHNAPMLFRPTEVAANRIGALGTLGYSNEAPHAQALQRVGACDVIRLETGGLAVGLFGESVYQQETVQLRPGDLLLLLQLLAFDGQPVGHSKQ